MKVLLAITLLVPFSMGWTLSPHLSDSAKAALAKTAASVSTKGKGITACDEGPATIGSRLEAVGIANSPEVRRQYRQMLFKTPNVNNHLSAAILDPETLLQADDDGTLFPEVLTNLGIEVGVKPHLKIYELPGTNGDTVMQGLDSLAARCKEYYSQGARFAKWRSPLVIDVSKGCPTDVAIAANMDDLARYALICQSEGLMPIVEPDVSLTGSHTLDDAVRINIEIQSYLFRSMIKHGVYMEGTTLKPNMINPGKDCTTSYTVEEIAEANVYVLKQAFPCAMPGSNYLSGGQSIEDAAARLSAINQAAAKDGACPWNLSFSWSAAIQFPLFDLCRGSGGVMKLDDMGALYKSELEIASRAALGTHKWKEGEGSHTGAGAAPPPPPTDAPPPAAAAAASFTPATPKEEKKGSIFGRIFG